MRYMTLPCVTSIWRAYNETLAFNCVQKLVVFFVCWYLCWSVCFCVCVIVCLCLFIFFVSSTNDLSLMWARSVERIMRPTIFLFGVICHLCEAINTLNMWSPKKNVVRKSFSHLCHAMDCNGCPRYEISKDCLESFSPLFIRLRVLLA